MVSYPFGALGCRTPPLDFNRSNTPTTTSGATATPSIFISRMGSNPSLRIGTYAHLPIPYAATLSETNLSMSKCLVAPLEAIETGLEPASEVTIAHSTSGLLHCPHFPFLPLYQSSFRLSDYKPACHYA